MASLRIYKKDNNISLAVLFLEYEDEGYGDSDQTFDRMKEYLQNLKQCTITYIRIDNKHENRELMHIEDGIFRVGGDNSCLEFSGWQKGIETLNTLGLPCDVVLFTNNALFKPGESFLKDYADDALLKKTIKNKEIIGRIDSFGKRFFIFDYALSKWVCTNCFFAPKAAIDDLGNIVRLKDDLCYFIEDDYNPQHIFIDTLITRSGLQGGHFSVKGTLHYSGLADLRISVDRAHNLQELGHSNDRRELSIYLADLQLSDQDINNAQWGFGFYGYPNEKWIARNALFMIPSHRSETLQLKGYVPPKIFKHVYNNQLRLKVFNDSLLFKQTAPMSRNFQQWIVRWLTTLWYASFEINHHTWETFRRKVLTILNEKLLSAKFIEMGYNLKSYGSKLYYE